MILPISLICVFLLFFLFLVGPKESIRVMMCKEDWFGFTFGDELMGGLLWGLLVCSVLLIIILLALS